VPGGRLAISARPRGNDWLGDELAGLRQQGIDVLVSLLTETENKELGLEREHAIATQKGLRFYSFPIEDRGVPASLSKAETLVAQLSSEMRHGKNVAVHCRQGIGRSGLLSAAILINAGEGLEQSLEAISKARGTDVPETSEQRNWLNQFEKAHAPEVARQNR